MNRSFSSHRGLHGDGISAAARASGTEPVPAARVSDGFFRTLGVKPMLGRDFLPGEDRPGQAKIVILSYGTWLKRFGGRSDVIGQSVTLSGDAYTIVGVLPREFAFAPRGNAEFWTPLLDKNGCEQRRSCHNLDGIGRLRDGVTPHAALEEMKAIAAQLEKQYPGSNHGQGASVIPLSELIVGEGAADSADSAGRGGIAVVDRLRERGESAVGAIGEPAARGCGAWSPGRNAGAADAAICHGRIAAGGCRELQRSARCRMDDVAAEARWFRRVMADAMPLSRRTWA